MSEIKLRDIDKLVVRLDERKDLTVEECCEASGLTLQRVYDRLNELLDATSPVRINYGVEMYPDNKTRLSAVALALELRKHIRDKSSTAMDDKLNIIIQGRSEVVQEKKDITEAEIKTEEG